MSDPTDPTEADDRAWFRAHVDPIVDAEPPADAWAQIEARSTTGAPELIAADSHPSLRWVAAAAVIALLAGAAILIATAQRDDDRSVTAGPGDVATGWYVPKALPDGWSLRSVTAVDGACEGASEQWFGPDPEGPRPAPSMELGYDSCGTVPSQADDQGAPGPALGTVIEESELEAFRTDPSSVRLRWESDGLWTLKGSGVTVQEVVAAARQIVADPRSEGPLPNGMELEETASSAGPLARRVVRVELVAPEGQVVRYDLTTPEGVPSRNPFTVDVEDRIDGQLEPVLRRDPVGFGGSPAPTPACCMTGSRYVGRWPGAVVDVDRSLGPIPTKFPNQQQRDDHDARVRSLIGILRPATAAEWQSFVATATDGHTDPRLTEAPTLAAFFHPSDSTATTTEPSVPTTPAGQPTTTTTTSPPFTPGDTPGSVVSGPGVFTPRDETSKMYTPIEDLDIRLELSSQVVRAGSPVEGTLIMRNKTDEPIEFNECSKYLTEWGLVPASTPDRKLVERHIIDCYGNQPNIGPKETVRFPLDWISPEGFVAQRQSKDGWGSLGTLPGGDYLAVVQIPGRTGDLRLSIPVTVSDPPCATTDDDVRAYLRHSLEGAKDVAAERGDEIRLVGMDGKQLGREDDLRCGRINIDITDGTVTNAVRF